MFRSALKTVSWNCVVPLMAMASIGCDPIVTCSLRIEVLDPETMVPIQGLTVESALALEPIDEEPGRIISERGQVVGVTDEGGRVDSVPVELLRPSPFESFFNDLVASAVLVRVSGEEGTDVFIISAFDEPGDPNSERLAYIRLSGLSVTGDFYELRGVAAKCP
jgi:hypothetical protein